MFMCRRVLLWRQEDEKSDVIDGRNPPNLLSKNGAKVL
jgi:hypothetical protein